MSDTLTALDATFLELEQQDEGALMSIGGVSVFDPMPGGGAPPIEEVCANLGARLDQLPRYSQRLSSVRTGGLGWPRWTDDDRFCIRDHISHVALPAPGGQAELCEWAADFYSHRLDRTRPLWEMALIDGLAEGRWALAHKTHHCLVDGVGSVDVAYLLLDTEPNAPERRRRRPRCRATPRSCSRSCQAHRSPSRTWRKPAPVSRGAGAHAALHPREALERSSALAELIVRDELIGAPHTSLNVTIGSTRRFAVVNRPLDEFKAIRRALGGVDQRRRARCVHYRAAPPASRARRTTPTARPPRDGPDERPPELRDADARQSDQLPIRQAAGGHRGCERAASPDRRHDRAAEVVERRELVRRR